MNLSLFLAKKIYNSKDEKHKVSRPAIHIATAGVAIGLIVMIISVAVVFGFKHTIQNKIVGVGCDISVCNYNTLHSSNQYPICVDSKLINTLQKINGVAHTQRYATTQGVLKTNDDFLGVVVKGVAQEYNFNFLKSCLVEGEFPTFSDSKNTNNIVISKIVANKLKLKVGQKVYAYFLSNGNVKTRRFKICGIYQTNIKMFDENTCITDLYTTIKLNNWEHNQASGVEVSLKDIKKINEVSDIISQKIDKTIDVYGGTYSSQTIFKAYPNIFSWLNLLDMNVWIILALMICVAGFTMISGLFIIILERTNMIGILKALGAKDKTIRHTFLWFSVFVIGKGMIIGNIIAITLCLIQQHFGFVTINPETYYISEVPAEINVINILIINIATLIISVLTLIIPSMIVAYIKPSKAIKYE